MTRPVVLLPYDPKWPGRFLSERELLAEALSGDCCSIEHIGSTAVPGLTAKPVIDVMIGVPVLKPPGHYQSRLEPHGYRYYGEPDENTRLVFARIESCNVHIVTEGGHEQRRHVAFRDLLRADPDLVRRYQELKMDLCGRFRNDRAAYTEGKTSFIEIALAAAGIRPVGEVSGE